MNKPLFKATKMNYYESKGSYEMMAAISFGWEAKATQLHKATLILWSAYLNDLEELKRYIKSIEAGLKVQPPEPAVLEQIAMLSGFCIENIFKQMIIYLKPELVKDGKIHGVLKSHDLILLSKEAGVILKDDECKYCQWAHNNMVAYGRYPIPISHEKLYRQMTFNPDKLMLAFLGLYDRTLKEVQDRFHSRVVKTDFSD